jgi:hypothetical protein
MVEHESILLQAVVNIQEAHGESEPTPTGPYFVRKTLAAGICNLSRVLFYEET